MGCFVLGWVGCLGFVLCWLAKKMLGGLCVESPVSPTRKTRLVTFTLRQSLCRNRETVTAGVRTWTPRRKSALDLKCFLL